MYIDINSILGNREDENKTLQNYSPFRVKQASTYNKHFRHRHSTVVPERYYALASALLGQCQSTEDVQKVENYLCSHCNCLAGQDVRGQNFCHEQICPIAELIEACKKYASRPRGGNVTVNITININGGNK